MKTLIIHIGAPKCESSSIQDFFLTNKSPSVEQIKFIKLCQQELDKIKTGNELINNYLTNIINDKLKLTNFLILSSESLFLKPIIIENICKIASEKIDRIKIIGYCRKSSDYVVSAYH